MKRIASFVLTIALVLGMGVSAFATGVPSKVVLDEVEVDASVTVSGLSGLGAMVEIKKIEEVAKTTEEIKKVKEDYKNVRTDVVDKVDLKKTVSEMLAGTEEQKENVKVEIVAVQTFIVVKKRLANFADVEIALKSKMLDAAYTENEKLVVLVAVPKVDAAGKVTYTYTKIRAVYKNGKVRVALTGRQLKDFGSTFTVIALKQVVQKAV